MSTFSDAYFDAGFFAACVCVLVALVIAVGRVPGLSKSRRVDRLQAIADKRGTR